MYLKSLVLKGFKSFADRSVLVLEPGITAVVGPNGSGKSNISDAVLWVLGERSAKNLRGQAMDDIIFAGSAARKAVSVAEVDLVLDNSDHMLPIDFDEVTIARRMYRSGESEYLVNGVVSRRLDVLDILHDTGLGTGTHSIISQGSLDSILQSRPEDRRTLIEEAAGVLKHKQRKEKSARKLAAMDNHLARVGDVVAELARQLGPLERKAKRAEAYKAASAELADCKLQLAVDDLRKLQLEWEAVCAAEKAALADVESRRADVAEAERKVNGFQELIQRETEGAGEIARRQRRAMKLSERLDGVEVRVRERRRAAIAFQADAREALDSSSIRRAAAVDELESASEQLDEVVKEHARAEARVRECADERASVNESHREAEDAISRIGRDLRACDDDLEAAKRRQASLQESLTSGIAKAKLAQARADELAVDVEKAQKEHDASRRGLDAAAEALADLAEREGKARDELLALFDKRDEAHTVRDGAREQVRIIEAEIKALENAQTAAHVDDPALSWVMENAERFGGTGALTSFSKMFSVSRSLETVVEALLADDLTALAVTSAGHAAAIADALRAGSLPGDVSLVLREDGRRHGPASARGCTQGRPLLDELTYPAESASAVEALLGDVAICDTRADAFAAHAADDRGLRFVSPDGIAIWPSGKVRIYGARDAADEGVIARERRIRELLEALSAAREACERAEAASSAVDEAYREMQVTSLKLSQQLANAQGAHEAALDVEQRAARRLQSLERDISEAKRLAASAGENVGNLEPELDAAVKRVAELAQKRTALVSEREALVSQAAPLRREVARLAEQLTEAKLEAAKLAERKTYVERIVLSRKRDIEAIDEDAVERRHAIAVRGVEVERGTSVLAVIGEIASGLSRRVRMLDDALAESESNTSSVHASAADARDEARLAHEGYDAASAQMTQVRVDKSRLEVRVEAAVGVIERDLGMPLDRAQQLPELPDRAAVEDAAFKLERRIKNMGAINPDAAAEYAKLKERYDYLAGQLADMEAARKSLRRIVRVIDARMKDDFVNTFNQVNANFNEIFSLLFPGGSASLALEDPDDVENTGVEVTAQPRGKRLSKMMLMSGGEKSLTALALLFAVYKTRATPFYILDEVEAALDDTNLQRLISYIDTLRSSTQLIMITHQRRTMEMADVLFGVSMQADGVTKVISQKLG